MSATPDKVCEICFENPVELSRACCHFQTCLSCLGAYVTGKVCEGQPRVQCPSCRCLLLDSEVLDLLASGELRAKWRQFLVDAKRDPDLKTCPRCGVPQTRPEEYVRKSKWKLRHGAPVTCDSCDMHWCFVCHAPWHEGLTCRKFKRGDRAMKEWSKEVDFQGSRVQKNAQKCPGCKSYIQRSSGCTHMTCPQCKTDFCYTCGDRYCGYTNKAFRLLIGNHHSKYSPLGCRQLFLPHNDAKRRLIRGALTGARFLGCVGAAAGIIVLGAGAAALIVAVGVVAGPVYGGYCLRKAVLQRRRPLKPWARTLSDYFPDLD